MYLKSSRLYPVDWQSALVERIGDLEKEVASFEQWEAEKKQYALTDFGGNTFAYSLKQDAANGEPAHRICPSCYEKREKAILQFRFRTATSRDEDQCSGCNKEFEFGHSQPVQPIRLRRS